MKLADQFGKDLSNRVGYYGKEDCSTLVYGMEFSTQGELQLRIGVTWEETPEQQAYFISGKLHFLPDGSVTWREFGDKKEGTQVGRDEYFKNALIDVVDDLLMENPVGMDSIEAPMRIEGSFPDLTDFAPHESCDFHIPRNPSIPPRQIEKILLEKIQKGLKYSVFFMRESVYSQRIFFISQYYSPDTNIPGSGFFQEMVRGVPNQQIYISHLYSFAPVEDHEGNPVFNVEVKSIGRYQRLGEYQIRNVKNSEIYRRCKPSREYYELFKRKLMHVFDEN